MAAGDFTSIAELPGSLLTREQQARMAHRYALAARWARGTRLLDVACGAGSGLGVWREQGRRLVVGLDYSSGVLPVAQATYGAGLPLLQGDAMHLPFAPASLETLLLFETLYYLPDAAAFCAEALRVLRPGGLLLIGQANPDWPAFVPGRLSRHYQSAPELAALLHAAGFASVQLYGAFPLEHAGRAARVRHSLRRQIVRAGLLPTTGPLADRLRRVAYGRLTPLPAALEPPTLQAQLAAEALLAPLDLAQPDRIHRVLYARAERSSAVVPIPAQV